MDVSFSSTMNFIVTFVYGDNYYVTRKELWDSIDAFASFNVKPWVLLGDFNSLLGPSEKVGGSPIQPCRYDFSRCVQSSQLLDLPYSGCFYTWTNC